MIDVLHNEADEPAPEKAEGELPEGGLSGNDLAGGEPAQDLPASMEAALDRASQMRQVEAVLFASPDPLTEAMLEDRLPGLKDLSALLADLAQLYEGRGVVLLQAAGGWAFRTAPDLAALFEREREVERRLSRAALETLAIIAYHQPVSRAEIEEIRGVGVSKGTVDVLLEQGWVRIAGRREAPGRPVTFGTTDTFLSHFGLNAVDDLPGLEDLKAAGLLDARPPPPEALDEASGDEAPDDEDLGGEAVGEGEGEIGEQDHADTPPVGEGPLAPTPLFEAAEDAVPEPGGAENALEGEPARPPGEVPDTGSL
ncbi:MAG: SMC-Scp complex subunit ScpB [Pseudomonadota bacterium]